MGTILWDGSYRSTGRFLLVGAAPVSSAWPPPFVPPAVPSAFLGAAPERGSVCGLSRDGLRRVSSAPEREVCPRWLVVGVRLVGCVTAAFAALWFSLIRV